MDNFGQKVIRLMVLTLIITLCSGTLFLIAVVKTDEPKESVTSVPIPKVTPYEHS